MSIDTVCPSCSRTLRVADEHAGKQARCPVCNHEYTIPAKQNQQPLAPGPIGASSQEPLEEPASVDAIDVEADTSQWSMKTPEGAMYGPVDRATLERWYADGRIAADCYLAEGGSGSWRPAAEIFPQLRTGYSQSAQSRPSQSSRQQPKPNSGPRASTVGYQGVAGRAHLRPHRGGLILALGLLGLMTCQLLGVMAWLMGAEDLKEIRAGRMDPEGEGLTQAGYVLGIISSILLAVSLIIVLFFLFLMAAIAAAGG